jgi:hypothetical protein
LYVPPGSDRLGAWRTGARSSGCASRVAPFTQNAVRLQLHALAYNLGNFLRTLATPAPIQGWSLTSLREKLIKIGAKVVSHGRYIAFQMAEVAIPRRLFGAHSRGCRAGCRSSRRRSPMGRRNFYWQTFSLKLKHLIRKGPDRMRYTFLLLAAISVSSCSQSVGSLPLSSGAQNQVTHATGEKPHINKVTRIKPEQYQNIVILGSGFGKMQPYNGDSAFIRIRDKTGAWDAGHISSSETDSVWLDVTQWSDSKIVITGFTNDYGQENWVLNKGDHLEVYVWNPKDGNGPATKDAKVQ